MKRFLLWSAAWSLLAMFFARVGTLIALLLVIRWLGADAYGEVALTQSIVQMMGGAIGIGMGMAATKGVAAHFRSAPARVGSIVLLTGASTLVMSVLTAAIIFYSRHSISTWAIGSSRLSPLLILSLPLLIASAFNHFQVGVISGFDEFKRVSLISGLGALVSFPIILAGVLRGGTEGALVALSLSSAVSCLLLQFEIVGIGRIHGVSFNFSSCRKEFDLVWQVGIPSVVLYALMVPADWIGLALLSRQPGGISEVGVYCAANQWCLALRFVPLAISTALMPSVARMANLGSEYEVRRTARLGLSLVAASAVPFSVLFAIMAPWIMSCYGPTLADRWLVLTWIMPASAGIALQIAGERVLAAMGWMWGCLWLNLFRGIVFCLVAIWAVQFGADGLAASRSITCLLHAFLVLLLLVFATWRLSDLSIRKRSASGPRDVVVASLPKPQAV